MNISAALIMKNEEHNLPRLLKSLQGKFNEIIVVDTGSTDRSIEIAKSFGCKVYQKEWNGFADARNYAIEKCSCNWIWHFDADFELEDDEFEKFKRYFLYLHNSEKAFMISVKNINSHGEVGSISSQIFIHKKEPSLYWIGNIHENLNIKNVYKLPIYINHYGYQHTAIQKDKALRNLELIRKDLEIYKNDKHEYFKKIFYMLQTYSILTYFYEIKDDWKEYVDEYLRLRNELKDNSYSTFFVDYGLVYVVNLLNYGNRYDEILRIKDLIVNPEPDLLVAIAEAHESFLDIEKAKRTYLKYLHSLNEVLTDHKNTVVDSLSKLPFLLSKKLPELFKENADLLYNEWKINKRAYYVGVLYAKVVEKSNPLNYEKMLLKFARRYEDRLVMQFLSQHYYQSGNSQDAFFWALKILEKNPYNLYANRLVALEYHRQNQYEQAMKHMIKVVEMRPTPEDIELLIKLLKLSGHEDLVEKFSQSLKNISHPPILMK